jgi:hypothetical protein
MTLGEGEEVGEAEAEARARRRGREHPRGGAGNAACDSKEAHTGAHPLMSWYLHGTRARDTSRARFRAVSVERLGPPAHAHHSSSTLANLPGCSPAAAPTFRVRPGSGPALPPARPVRPSQLRWRQPAPRCRWRSPQPPSRARHHKVQQAAALHRQPAADMRSSTLPTAVVWSGISQTGWLVQGVLISC